MKENPKAFIPAWLNNLRLSQAEFRVYCCLAARADTTTCIAWPQSSTIAQDCCMAPNTVWKSIRGLEEKQLIQKAGKPFGGSNRYRISAPPISANGIPIEGLPISANGIPIDEPPIVSNEIHQSYQMDRCQSAQMDRREGITNKDYQVSTTKGDLLPFNSEGFKAAWNDWKQHRKEKRKKLTPLSINKQFKELSEIGETRAIAAINHSIKKGYEGIYEPSGAKGKQQATTPVNTTKRQATVNTI